MGYRQTKNTRLLEFGNPLRVKSLVKSLVKSPTSIDSEPFPAQGGCWWDYIQCLKMRKRKRKKRKKRKKKIRKKGGRRELNLK